MSKVVYRGQVYDTEVRKQAQAQQQQEPQQYNETYRGVRFVKEGHKWKNLMYFNSSKSRSKKNNVAIKHY